MSARTDLLFAILREHVAGDPSIELVISEIEFWTVRGQDYALTTLVALGPNLGSLTGEARAIGGVPEPMPGVELP